MNVDTIYGPFFRYFRTRRLTEFVRLLSIRDQTIIDVGGTPYNWRLITQSPQITLVNVGESPELGPNMRHVKGDGRKLAFGDDSFEIAYSNSVIEHVGAWGDQVAFAREIRRVAPRYYVQTPNRRFVIEPHFIAPFIHWFPKGWRKKLLPLLSLRYWISNEGRAVMEEMVDEVRLLDEREMGELFPDAQIIRERFLFMTKSLIAVRT